MSSNKVKKPKIGVLIFLAVFCVAMAAGMIYLYSKGVFINFRVLH